MGKQTLIYLGLFCFLFPFTNQRGIAFGEPINVLIYSKYDEYPHRYNGGGRLRELEGFTVHYATDTNPKK